MRPKLILASLVVEIMLRLAEYNAWSGFMRGFEKG
jgi:hypothetical protein